MQAALMIRSKKRVARRKRLRKEGRLYDLPSNVSVKQLQPFPQYPPDQWVGDLDTSVKCAQGRAAWLERGRRCSVSENAASCHRRWVKRNRIHDSSLGGSSDDDDFLGALRGPSSFANAFLYVGLGTIAIGLVIAFVGTGEKGFKTVELRLIGPSLIGVGLVCCILRIFFCICPSNCISSSRTKLKKKNAKIDADHTTSLLRGDNKRVSISRGAQPKFPPPAQKFFKQHSNSKMHEGMEALRQIATTSLFLQNEQSTIENNRIVPTIKEPDKYSDQSLEMEKIKDKIGICNISDDDDLLLGLNNETINHELSTSLQNSDICTVSIPSTAVASASHASHTINTSIQLQQNQQQRPNKLLRSRAPVNQQQKSKDSDMILMETSLMALDAASSMHTNVDQPLTIPTSQAATKSVSSLVSSPPPSSTKSNSHIGNIYNGSAAAFVAVPSTSGRQNFYRQQSLTMMQNTTFSSAVPLAPTFASSMDLEPMKAIIQDGSTKLTIVKPAPNVISSTNSGNINSMEPELVLSPANLGQEKSFI